ncbi:MAG: transglutaminase domain-containing protein [Phenylobacterium sp.]|uniref:transglutaminase family protein n=1 Tax=Phenylobacterium sp. TaxID=1871053 RepID=UPI003919DB1B
MSRLTIRHETRYAYEHAVAFGPHELLLRPRGGHALRVVKGSLTFSPRGETRWRYDAYGNCVCQLTPLEEAAEFLVVSELEIERFPAPLAPQEVDDPRTATPIVYPANDRAVLGPYVEPATDDPDGVLLRWLHGQAPEVGEPALDYVLRLNRAIHDAFEYQARYEEGVQAPFETVARRSGTCRDFAWLMVEVLRRLGFAARFVSGYLHSPGLDGVRGAGATHAWCEVFLPAFGWMDFDPTNALAEAAALIPVAVSRTPAEAAPISGAIIGVPGESRMEVKVDVRLCPPLASAA